MSLIKFAIAPLPVPPGWYAIPLRMIIGFGFFAHGYAKLLRGPDHFAGILAAIGMPLPELQRSSLPDRASVLSGAAYLAGVLVLRDVLAKPAPILPSHIAQPWRYGKRRRPR